MTRCFCIFEGGGAKGIAHVGALRALEDAKFKFVGFAGTSAGAIVAALAACGYTSRDLFGDEGSLLDKIDGDRSNVWGGSAFHPLRTPPRLLGRPGWTFIRAYTYLSKVWWLIAALLIVISSGLPFWMGFWSPGTMVAAQAGLVVMLAAIPFLLIYPVASLKPMASAINQALSLKVRGTRSTQPVTFADLRKAGCPTLKIVATDISARSLVLFSADTTPDVAVGDAVAASACIPGVFRAHRIGERLCYDGGLVSNLPAWAFDAERSTDRDSWTAVVEVRDVTSASKPNILTKSVDYALSAVFGTLRPRGLGILSATVSTAVFGAGVLNTRNVERLRSQPLDVDLGVLEFGVRRRQAVEIVESSYNESVASIVYQMRNLPDLIDDMCERLRGQMLGLINIARTSEGLARFEGRVRIALFFPSRDDPHSLISEFNNGFDDDPDERIRLPIASSLVGKVWSEDQGYYIDEDDEEEWNGYLARPEDRWVRKVRWSEMSWLIAVPYLHGASGRRLAVAVDADQPLEVRALDPLLDTMADQIETMLDRNLPLEAFAWLT